MFLITETSLLYLFLLNIVKKIINKFNNKYFIVLLFLLFLYYLKTYFDKSEKNGTRKSVIFNRIFTKISKIIKDFFNITYYGYIDELKEIMKKEQKVIIAGHPHGILPLGLPSFLKENKLFNEKDIY